MRKLISLGLLALMFSLISGQVLAGKIQVCEDIKYDPDYKGLYGLCNAYWNADNDTARAAILANFQEKAGPDGPTMPGLKPEEPTCPCWTPESLALAVAGHDGAFCIASVGFDNAIYEGNVPQVWAGMTPFVDPNSNTTGTECRLGTATSSFISETTPGEDEVCRSDVQALQDSTDELGNYIFPLCITF